MDTYKPTSAMASNAKKAKKMRDSQPASNKGMTQTGLTRMNQLINREPLSLSTVKRMYSFFSRHEVDKKTESWKKGNSKGEQGWLGWGGDAGYRWSKSIVERESKAEDEMSARQVDQNGYTVIKDNNISKVGVYPYLGRQLPNAEDPNKIYNVYRPREVLEDAATIDSFKSIPWIDKHRMLGKAFNASDSKADGIVTDNVYFEYPYLKADLKIFNSSLEDKINNGKRDLSPGYTTKYLKQKGVFDGIEYDYIQTTMRGNHLATVQEGRTGKDVSVLDSSNGIMYDEPCISFDSKDLIMTTEKKTVTLESLQESMDSMLDLIAAQDEKINELTSAKDASYDKDDKKKMAKDEDDEDDDDDDEKRLSSKDKKKPAMDQAAFDSAIASALSEQKATFDAQLKSIADGQRLAAQLTKHTGAFDSAGMTEHEVAKFGCEKLEIAADDGAEVIFLKAHLQAKEAAPKLTTANDSAISTTVLDTVNKY